MQSKSGSTLATEAARVFRIVSSIAFVMATLVAIAPPLGYFLINYNYLSRESNTHAVTSAELLARHIYGNRQLWRYEHHRLEEILIRENPQGRMLRQRILELDGTSIIAVGPEIKSPSLVGRSEILESGQIVGTLEVEQSLRPTLLRTGIVTLLSVLSALAIIVATSAIPLRELRKALTRLYVSQRDLKLARDAFDQSSNVIFITGSQGEIVYFNRSFVETGSRYPGAALPERLAAFTNVLTGVDFAEIWQTLRRGSVWKGRYSIASGGAVRVADAVCSPIAGEAEHELHYIYVEQDITEQVRTEAALRDSQRMETLGRLAGGIAHDINNIITPIMGYADLLLDKAPEGTDERKYLQVIAQSALRARDVVSRVLLFSRKKESQRVQWHLHETVREVVALLKSSLASSIEMTSWVEDELATVDADPIEMYQLLMNLCLNAALAMPKGGKMLIGQDTKTLNGVECLFGQTLTGTYVHLVVVDTGIGMDEETLAHAFEPYFTTRGPGEGTGIGLATVYGIVELHRGGIAVSSRPGDGTRMDVYLPARAAAEADAAETIETAAVTGTGNILVVDDEPNIAILLQQVLEGLGYRVETALDPQRALDMFKSQPSRYDLVITDRTMPGLSGQDLAQELWRVRADIPVILCTGYADAMGTEGACALGFRKILHKPVGATELSLAVAAVLAP